MSERGLSRQQKFAFFDRYGYPNSSPESKAAYRRLPFGKRFWLTCNLWALLFGPLYFFVKGVWRKGLVLVGIAIALAAVATYLDLPRSIERFFWYVVPILAMNTANYAHYLHAVKGSRSWNPFEGVGWR
ncbi:DUF2628 domain-containing protein [Mycolicibacterium phlei]